MRLALHSRTLNLIGFSIVVLVLALSAYVQLVKGVSPCPLCILQRCAFIMVGIIFFMGVVLKQRPAIRLIIACLGSLFAGAGFFIAARQSWLQHMLSAQSTDCGPDLNYMLQALPLKQVILKIFSGSTECSAITWQLMGLTMADWSCLVFAVLVGIAIQQLRKA